MNKAFHKTTWSKVEVGDTVLIAWSSLNRIIEVEIKQCETMPALDAKPLVFVAFIAFDSAFYPAFDPDETVYVQSRL